ncbi:MAG: hypothetical protein AAGB03_02095, partial [Pseudomonadota bacterium]
ASLERLLSQSEAIRAEINNLKDEPPKRTPWRDAGLDGGEPSGGGQALATTESLLPQLGQTLTGTSRLTGQLQRQTNAALGALFEDRLQAVAERPNRFGRMTLDDVRAHAAHRRAVRPQMIVAQRRGRRVVQPAPAQGHDLSWIEDYLPSDQGRHMRTGSRAQGQQDARAPEPQSPLRRLAGRGRRPVADERQQSRDARQPAPKRSLRERLMAGLDASPPNPDQGSDGQQAPTRANRTHPLVRGSLQFVRAMPKRMPPSDPVLAVGQFGVASGSTGGGSDREAELSRAVTKDLSRRLAKLPAVAVMAPPYCAEKPGKTRASLNLSSDKLEKMVRYELGGSVHLLGNRVRITAFLIDRSTGDEVWSRRHQCSVRDLPTVQNELAVELAEHLVRQRRADGEPLRALVPA